MTRSDEQTSAPLVGIWNFARLQEARDGALLLAARGLVYEIDAVRGAWVLMVEEHAAGVALEELARMHSEQARLAGPVENAPTEPIRIASLLLPGLVMGASFQWQLWAGERWTEAGLAASHAMLREGQWWRAVTALTLHGDFGHFLANLLTSLFFAAFLQPELGRGVAWLLIVASGALGNLLNAWGYRHEAHYSLGASTAVFGALGLLVAADIHARWRHPATRHRWSIILPLGAGLSLLAYLGVGDGVEHIDFMAHGWGFASGGALGLALAAVTGGRRLPAAAQWAAGGTVMALLAVSWLLAARAL